VIETQDQLDLKIRRRFRQAVAKMVLCGTLATVAIFALEGWGCVLLVTINVLLGIFAWRSYRFRVALLTEGLNLTRAKQKIDDLRQSIEHDQGSIR